MWLTARHTGGVRQPLPTERTVLQGLSIARWGAVCWIAATTILQRKDVANPTIAVASIAAAVAVAAMHSYWLRKQPSRLVRPVTVAIEVALALYLYAADGWAYGHSHFSGGGQNLAGSAPDIAAISAGTVLGPWWGALVGAVLGLGRFLGAITDHNQTIYRQDSISVLSTMVFSMLAAFVFGSIARLLRQVETEVLGVRARADIARTLHDGVLQTLALVERRTRESDPELAAVARRSDRKLRAWLFHGNEESGDLSSRLRAVADQVSGEYDVPITMSLVDDDSVAVDPSTVHALAGAAGEAMVNAVKHGSPTTVVVFAEVNDDSVFVSVRDDGCGFDPGTAARGQGLDQSIMARMADIGGRATITSAPGEGTEVQLWSK